MLNILLVGCGKMGGAMANSWKEIHIYNQLLIVDPTSDKIKSFKDLPSDFYPNIIVFAVKPQIIGDVIDDYKKYTNKGAVALSIIAGKPISFFEKHLGSEAKIIRSMPNLPASIGKGMLAAYANNNVNKKEKTWAETLLSASGEFLWVDDEDFLNPVTSLSGSGPAYVFLLIETMALAGQTLGLDKKTSEKLARQTVIGSAALVEASPNITAAKLRENVTSKGGTTAAALKVLMADKGGIQELFNKALLAANDRAKDLSK